MILEPGESKCLGSTHSKGSPAKLPRYDQSCSSLGGSIINRQAGVALNNRAAGTWVGFRDAVGRTGKPVRRRSVQFGRFGIALGCG